MNTNKRKDDTGDVSRPKRVKKECDYGEKCYRRNPAHFREFSHKHLESILNMYSGTGDYPIPDKYVMERLALIEQLDVIIEKGLYTPCKGGQDCLSQSQSSSSSTAQSSQQNTVGRSADMGSRNADMGSRIADVTARNADVTARNADLNSKNADMGSRNADVGSRNADLSSRNADVASKTADVSSRNSGGSSNNNTIGSLNYRKAADYRPIVAPTRRVEDFLPVVLPKGKMAAKHALTAPYYIFYTTIKSALETHTQKNSITFQEILDSSLGELKCSLQINFMVELGWLLAQYYFAGYSEKKLTILYGEDMPELKTISQKKPHIDAHRVTMATPFGTHHTKMMILCYEDGSLRVVISTANLYQDDWENRTQGLWFSPRCPELRPDAMPHDGESPTHFKRSLIRYLHQYSLAALVPYTERVQRCDFSDINVFLVASVPGSHSDENWGLKRAGALLRNHCAPNDRWAFLAQASSLGSYGPQPNLWLTGDFLNYFTKTKNPRGITAPPELKLIYPSLENVRRSHDGLLGGGCLPYGSNVQAKQPWLIDYLYQWRAYSTGRNRAMPHIKSYMRLSPDNKMAAYYLLTSANASKAAWGSINKGNGNLRIMSYEAGVLFLPQFVINKDFFPLTGDSDSLPLAYDVPPTKYTEGMSPWVMDYLHH